jgi:cobalamin biosynthesis Co2+ chelatase CbiK
MKLESEIAEWKPFMKALPSMREKEAFEELMNHCRRHTMAAGASVRPIMSDAMFMSILLAHEKELREIKALLEKLNNEKEKQQDENSQLGLKKEVPAQ